MPDMQRLDKDRKTGATVKPASLSAIDQAAKKAKARERALTPQTRAIRKLQADGWTVDVVERIERCRGKTWRKDLFGGFDLLAVRDSETLAVQATTRGHINARVAKIAELETVPALRAAGWKLEVWGYGKTVRGGDWRIVDVS